MAYNMTAIEAANTTASLMTATIDLTGGWWARFFLIGMFVAISIPIWIKTGETLKGMIGASFVTTVLSIIMYGLDWVGPKEPAFSLVLLAGLSTILLVGGFD